MIIASSEKTINDAKTKELIVYIADRLKDNPKYGKTLLNKTLYFIDNISYINTKKPISSFKYVRQDFGATPAPAQFIPITKALLEENVLQEIKTDYYGRIQKKYIPTRQPSTEHFTKEEIILIDKVIGSMGNFNASESSNFSHNFLCWQITDNFEELPFYSFLLTSKAPSPEAIEWGKSQIK